jgi:hypothetical protein
LLNEPSERRGVLGMPGATLIRIVNLNAVRETGKMEAAWNPGTVTTQRIGGGSLHKHIDRSVDGQEPSASME